MSLKTKLNVLLTLGQGLRGLMQGLSEESAGRDPIRLFGEWFAHAEASGVALPEAITLATCTKEGVPSARMVLLRGFDDRGFVFYTNYASRKSAELEANPRAALVCHWAVLQRQVRIEGSVTRTSTGESEAYFRSRPYGSRVGAWASKQSSTLDGTTELERRVRAYEQRFAGQDVPCPPFWGGYRVEPTGIEFWQGRASRLHDRLRYERSANGWDVRRLYP